ncbi:MAG TPA: hypothetical protein PK280_11050 [Planctomycetota bacterium]|nr:hypothetical protein [Planctomycetota bacterium]
MQTGMQPAIMGLLTVAFMMGAGRGGEIQAKPAPAEAGAVPAGAVDILSIDSYWRWFATLRKPVIPVEALKASGQPAEAPRPLVGKEVPPPYDQVDQQESPAAPAGWDSVAFDDYGWPRSRIPWMRGLACRRFSSAALCLRGRFQVTDPAAVQGLYLTIKYYGGVRVCLNGKEIARGHLPAGELKPETPAEMYPKDVYVDDKGVIVPFGEHPYYWERVTGDAKRDAEERKARRTRVLGPVKLPADAIRKGENLLTIELRRSEYPFEALRWFKAPEGATKPYWIPMNIFDLRLQAAGSGAAPNLARPKGVQVWTEDTNVRLTPLDYGDSGEGLRPMRIVGARNGSFCGQLVIGSDAALKAPKVTVGDLKAAKGGGVIPGAGAAVLYALPDVAFYGRVPWFDALQAEPPAEVPVAKPPPDTRVPPAELGAVQPVLLRVTVPKDAPAGDYRGEAVVTAGGAEVARVPIELSVADWTLPEPKDYRTYVGVYQSPTSLAMQYKVPEWSEEHWKLMEKSFALLGRAGNRLVNVTVVDKTQFGNDDGMISWVKKPDGSFTYDFKVFDRYMDLAQKHLKLEFVAMHIWHSPGDWAALKADQETTVTVVDEKTGERSHMQVPRFDSEEAKKFWKPFLDAVQERLAKRGLEKAMILGILSDSIAPKEVFAVLNEVTPGGARWMRGCHQGTYSQQPDKLPGGGVTVLHEFCYGTPLDAAKPAQPYYKQRNWPGTDYERMSGHEQVVGLSWYRETGMTALMRRTRGVGRICLDFWPLIKSRRGDLYNRWPHSSCAQREPSLKKMVWPAPDGAGTTMRYEAFCEGIQFAEALVVVSEILDTKAAAMGPEKADELRRRLTDLWSREVRAGNGEPLRPNHEGWQPVVKWLFDAAGEGARAK